MWQFTSIPKSLPSRPPHPPRLEKWRQEPCRAAARAEEAVLADRRRDRKTLGKQAEMRMAGKTQPWTARRAIQLKTTASPRIQAIPPLAGIPAAPDRTAVPGKMKIAAPAARRPVEASKMEITELETAPQNRRMEAEPETFPAEAQRIRQIRTKLPAAQAKRRTTAVPREERRITLKAAELPAVQAAKTITVGPPAVREAKWTTAEPRVTPVAELITAELQVATAVELITAEPPAVQAAEATTAEELTTAEPQTAVEEKLTTTKPPVAAHEIREATPVLMGTEWDLAYHSGFHGKYSTTQSK